MKGKLLVHIIVILILILQYGCGDGDGVDDRGDFESTGYYMHTISMIDIGKISNVPLNDDYMIEIIQSETGVDTMIRDEQYVDITIDPRFPIRIVSRNGTTLLLVDTPFMKMDKIENNSFILTCTSDEKCSGGVYIVIRSPENHLLMRQIWIHSKYLLGKLVVTPSWIDLSSSVNTVNLCNVGLLNNVHLLPMIRVQKCISILPSNFVTNIGPGWCRAIEVSRTCTFENSSNVIIPIPYFIRTASNTIQFYSEPIEIKEIRR